MSYNKIKHNIVSNPDLLIGLEVSKETIKDIEARFNHTSIFACLFETKQQKYYRKRKCRILYPEDLCQCDVVFTRINIYVEENNDGTFFIARYCYG